MKTLKTATFALIATVSLAACDAADRRDESGSAADPRAPAPAASIAAAGNEAAVAGEAPARRLAPWQSTALLAPDGIDAATATEGHREALSFGTARTTVEGAVAAGSGIAAIGRDVMAECGAGPIDATRYPGGLSLHFQDEKFVGWALSEDDGPRWAMRDGSLGIGASASTIPRGDRFDSTLGLEFSHDGVAGLIENDRVVALWGGTSCNFR